jgi:hypothetical protein
MAAAANGVVTAAGTSPTEAAGAVAGSGSAIRGSKPSQYAASTSMSATREIYELDGSSGCGTGVGVDATETVGATAKPQQKPPHQQQQPYISCRNKGFASSLRSTAEQKKWKEAAAAAVAATLGTPTAK